MLTSSFPLTCSHSNCRLGFLKNSQNSPFNPKITNLGLRLPKKPPPLTMKLHPTPTPKKRAISDDAAAAGAFLVSRQKKLRRLPHIFSKVLELPFPSDADVAVNETPTNFTFSVAADFADVSADTIEIYTGVTKVVIRDGGGDVMEGEVEEISRWRFRLPEETRVGLATAECVDGELVVRIPKEVGNGEDDDDDDDDEEERRGFEIGRTVVVQ